MRKFTTALAACGIHHVAIPRKETERSPVDWECPYCQAAKLQAQINRVCVRWLDTQDEYGIWYSMTDCGLSETVGEVKSEIQDGRKFCPCCGGAQALQEGEL